MEKTELDQNHIMPVCPQITTEDINAFFEGSDPMKGIVSIELGYQDAEAEIVYVNEKGQKRLMRQAFKPFAWAKNSACIRMCGGRRGELKRKMREYGIAVKPLYTCTADNPHPHEKLDNGYKYLFYATHKMAMGTFQRFFTEVGTPLKPKKVDNSDPSSQEFMTVSPTEQFMIQTGKRFFKGFDNYDDLKRMSFDLETEGLNPRKHHISQIGIRTNKGYERIITVTGATLKEKEFNEQNAIEEFTKIIGEEKPDVIFGHNTENFDWDFIIKRCEHYGVDYKDLSAIYLREGIYKQKRPTTLKLGGEVETYYATQIKYYNVVDSLHAVRRAMATDSSFESANLKYATKYLHLNKKNRVYVPGNIIDSTWLVTDKVYAFNDEDGDWYKITKEKPLKEGYELQSGRYIVERYLLDDIWEADKVELTLHETDFHLTKIMPTTFMRVCTMGTATQWKLIMLTWAYQHNLAIPTLSLNKKFTGGLSRLLVTGYMENIVKLDANSLYPSSILTWNVSTATDIMGVMLKMLRYVLTQREHFKGLKKDAAIKAEELYHKLKNMSQTDPNYKELTEERKHYLAEKVNNDNQQLILKKLGNSFFGSFGCPSVFNFADLDAAEKTTCLGRMQLRIMIHYFHTIGQRNFPKLPKEEQEKYNYTPIVGDSVSGDCPLFIRNGRTGMIDIKPISELINESHVEIDALGREYDYSNKDYEVLCRSGWCKPNYIYRHSTDKDIYRVSDNNSCVDITKDHSLFDSNKKEIKPAEINKSTKLEFNQNNIWSDFNGINDNFDDEYFINQSRIFSCNDSKLANYPWKDAKSVVRPCKAAKSVPISCLNATLEHKKLFIDNITTEISLENGYSKTAVAGFNYIKKCLSTK